MSRYPLSQLLVGACVCVAFSGCDQRRQTSATTTVAVTTTTVKATKASTTMDNCAARRARADDAGGRIVGGEPARPGSAPWQAEILSSPRYDAADRAYDASLANDDPCKIHLAERAPYELAHKCGGAYIGHGWVITAAHCVDNIPSFDGHAGNVLTDRRVRLGTQNLTVEDGLFAIDAVVIHSGYGKQTKLDDIALIRLLEDPRLAAFETDGRLLPVRTMAADDRDFDPAEALRVTGWGWMGRRNEHDAVSRMDSAHQLQRNPADLQQLTLNYLPDAQCAAEYGTFYGPGALCAGTLAVDGSIAAGKDSCQGDSGGPLTREEDGGVRSLVGVVSGGKGCGAGKPAVYTRVSYYAAWIRAAEASVRTGEVLRIPRQDAAPGSP